MNTRLGGGWFGEPWWSFICYDEDGELLTGRRVPFPCGDTCLWCGEQFGPGDSGVQRLCILRTGAVMRHTHKECDMRSVLGPVAHLEGRCYCRGGTDWEKPGRTKRQEALAVWDWVQKHGTAVHH